MLLSSIATTSPKQMSGSEPRPFAKNPVENQTDDHQRTMQKRMLDASWSLQRAVLMHGRRLEMILGRVMMWNESMIAEQMKMWKNKLTLKEKIRKKISSLFVSLEKGMRLEMGIIAHSPVCDCCLSMIQTVGCPALLPLYVCIYM